ncbi:MAG: 4-alpha-glucanotransferase [Akkermansiaceae bacterium]|nr:4-alpha-glucanotransferase [Akkermansiaceae bacterium]
MKIVFRVNYHTVLGQSLWLIYTDRETKAVPMQWLNHEQWEVSLDFDREKNLPTVYHYQLRQQNGVKLDEWLPRSIIPKATDELLLLDTWCSAGTVDYAFETDAFKAILPQRGPFQTLKTSSHDNHLFQLRMASVPADHVPCLIGNVHELGGWDWCSVVPLLEIAPNVWKASLYLPEDIDLEYKYGLFDCHLRRAVSLECGENRIIPSRRYSSRQMTVVSDEGYRRDGTELPKGAGVAIPIFSLRSQSGLGVGEIADLKLLADWAKNVGLKLIQILPINDTTSSFDWTDSYPYSAISIFALHPIYLRLDDLDYPMPVGFLSEIEVARAQLNELHQLDYEAVMSVKWKLTRQIFTAHQEVILAGDRYQIFLEKNREWLIPYAAFCVLRDHYGTADFSRWEEWKDYDRKRVAGLSENDHPDFSKAAYYIWLQCELDHQLTSVVDHLHRKGIALKGDLPIGIDRRSVDAWSLPHLFKMDAQAGAPPDDFAVKGQNWGFPTYDWEVMRRDGYAWWRGRFEQLSRYFDAYRIDHILGFFRIWQVPTNQVEGIMGYFDPALPIHIDEFSERGIDFDFDRFCKPYLLEGFLKMRFGKKLQSVKEKHLDVVCPGLYQLREEVFSQRQIMEFVSDEEIRDGLLDCASNVLFFEVPNSKGKLFHPRCMMQTTSSYEMLDTRTQEKLRELYVDYFFSCQEDFWQAHGYEKLPAMRRASSMLLCGEDLGMVPNCVPDVLKQLGILSLEIQRMPKSAESEFLDPRKTSYLSVVSPSTHDMPTLRAWWREDAELTARFAKQMLNIASPESDLSGEVARQIILQHLESPAMWAIFPLQDLLAIDEQLRHPAPEMERINVPSIMPFNWRYRMHLSLEQLAKAEAFSAMLKKMIGHSRR